MTAALSRAARKAGRALHIIVRTAMQPSSEIDRSTTTVAMRAATMRAADGR
jgi:hypothetical protein